MELSEAIVLRIKQLLKEKNMKTYDLSIKSGVPRSTISLFLSRETKTIRLENLLYLCEGFGIELKDFFNDTKDEQIVFSKEDYFEKNDSELKNSIQWIIPNAQKNTMEPILLTLEQGGSTYPDNPHEGEEFGYVLKGSVEIHIGGKIYKAKKGESFYYEAKYSHHIESKKGATIIWVSSPPSF